MTRPCIVMAGGGTGGHVFPMLAVADELQSLMPELELCFVGTEKGLESRLVPARGYPLRLVDILPLRGGGLPGVWRGLTRAVGATVAERRVLAALAPRAVFSIGGYAAGPVAAAAVSLGIPVALMEPNSVIGLANRWMAPFVQRAYTAFAESEAHFRKDVVLRTGVPIRSDFAAQDYRLHAPPRILVLGGSQGAASLNETLPRACARLPFAASVVHQVGAAQKSAVLELYAAAPASLQAEVVPFIEDMPSALANTDLVVSRSGAGAVSEICAVGRPSLLVPYPHAAGDHQRKNAAELVRQGASVLLEPDELQPERLARQLALLLTSERQLAGMAAAARQLGRPAAASEIARDLLQLAGLSQAKNRSYINELSQKKPLPPSHLSLGDLKPEGAR